MSESNVLTPIEPPDELATLRRVNAELVTKNSTRKAKVKELEASVMDLQGKLTIADTTIHELSINAPLKAMAESISIAPDAFIHEFSKSYRLDVVKGELTILTPDGKPVLQGDKPIPFERDALKTLLTSADHPQAKVFNSILIVSRASGAGGVPSNTRGQRNNRESEPSPPPQFGLR